MKVVIVIYIKICYNILKITYNIVGDDVYGNKEFFKEYSN